MNAASWQELKERLEKLGKYDDVKAEAASGSFSRYTVTMFSYMLRNGDGELRPFVPADIPEEDKPVVELLQEALRPAYEEQGREADVNISLSFRTAKQLQTAKIPPQKWLIKDMIAEEQVCLLAAPRKIGKSWFCLEAAIAICTGSPFLGHSTNKAAVLYCDLESGLRRPKSRIETLLGGAAAPDGLLVSISGEVYRLDKGFAEQMRELKRLQPDVKLVIVDVMQRIMPPTPKGVDAYTWAYDIIGSQLKPLAEALHIAFLLVTHTRKGTSFSTGDPFDEVIGSTGIVSAADNLLVIRKDWKTGETSLHTTGKDIVAPEDAAIQLQGCHWQMLGNMDDVQLQRQAEAFRNSAITATILKLIDNNGGSWQGTASEIIKMSEAFGLSITENVSRVGRFIEANDGLLWAEENITVKRTLAQGCSRYKFTKKQ